MAKVGLIRDVFLILVCLPALFGLFPAFDKLGSSGSFSIIVFPVQVCLWFIGVGIAVLVPSLTVVSAVERAVPSTARIAEYSILWHNLRSVSRKKYLFLEALFTVAWLWVFFSGLFLSGDFWQSQGGRLANHDLVSIWLTLSEPVRSGSSDFQALFVLTIYGFLIGTHAPAPGEGAKRYRRVPRGVMICFLAYFGTALTGTISQEIAAGSLEWQRIEGPVYWEGASKKCEGLGAGWRLPTPFELRLVMAAEPAAVGLKRRGQSLTLPSEVFVPKEGLGTVIQHPWISSAALTGSHYVAKGSKALTLIEAIEYPGRGATYLLQTLCKSCRSIGFQSRWWTTTDAQFQNGVACVKGTKTSDHDYRTVLEMRQAVAYPNYSIFKTAMATNCTISSPMARQYSDLCFRILDDLDLPAKSKRDFVKANCMQGDRRCLKVAANIIANRGSRYEALEFLSLGTSCRRDIGACGISAEDLSQKELSLVNRFLKTLPRICLSRPSRLAAIGCRMYAQFVESEAMGLNCWQRGCAMGDQPSCKALETHPRRLPSLPDGKLCR